MRKLRISSRSFHGLQLGPTLSPQPSRHHPTVSRPTSYIAGATPPHLSPQPSHARPYYYTANLFLVTYTSTHTRTTHNSPPTTFPAAYDHNTSHIKPFAHPIILQQHATFSEGNTRKKIKKIQPVTWPERGHIPKQHPGDRRLAVRSGCDRAHRE